MYSSEMVVESPVGRWLKVLAKVVFFFSSRRRHTRSLSDWSSDVCSSDLGEIRTIISLPIGSNFSENQIWCERDEAALQVLGLSSPTPASFANARNGSNRSIGIGKTGGELFRSEERRVGEEGRFRWSPYH